LFRHKEEAGIYRKQGINNKELIKMAERHVDIEERHVEKKMDSSHVMATFIKYAAYIILFFGALYFLVRFVFPMF
jgi:hypothetical protein